MPSSIGGALTFLKRLWFPPPQVAEHFDQSVQSIQRQSLVLHSGVSPWHPRTSSRFPSQPLPPGKASCSTLRVRFSTPCPQCSEHPDHCVHFDKWQLPSVKSFFTEQGWSWHGLVCMRTSVQASPPFASARRLRERYVCPASHVLLQSVHDVHAPTSQSLSALAPTHGSASSTVPLQGSPFWLPSATDRNLVRVLVAFLHGDHNSQSPR